MTNKYNLSFRTTLHSQTTLELLCLTDKYGFDQLKEALSQRLCAAIDCSNVLQLFFHAEAANATTLQQHCEGIIDANAQMLLAGNTILMLPLENLRYLLSRDSFIVEEVHIFHAVCRWKEHNKATLEDVSRLLECVRLSEIPQQELIGVVSPSGMYSAASLYTVLESQRKQVLLRSPPTRGRLPGTMYYSHLP